MGCAKGIMSFLHDQRFCYLFSVECTTDLGVAIQDQIGVQVVNTHVLVVNFRDKATPLIPMDKFKSFS